MLEMRITHWITQTEFIQLLQLLLTIDPKTIIRQHGIPVVLSKYELSSYTLNQYNAKRFRFLPHFVLRWSPEPPEANRKTRWILHNPTNVLVPKIT